MFVYCVEKVAPLLLKTSRCVLVLALGTAKSVIPILEHVRNVNQVSKVLAVRSVRNLLLPLLLLLPAASSSSSCCCCCCCCCCCSSSFYCNNFFFLFIAYQANSFFFIYSMSGYCKGFTLAESLQTWKANFIFAAHLYR